MNLITEDKKTVYLLRLELDADEAWELYKAMCYNNAESNIATWAVPCEQFQNLLLNHIPEIKEFIEEEKEEAKEELLRQ